MAFKYSTNFPNQSESLMNAVGRVTVESLTETRFFADYQKKGIPVVITGLLAVGSEWNLEYLCQRLGNQKFPLRHYGRDRYEQEKRFWKNIGSGVTGESKPFVEYAAMLRDRTAHQKDIYLAKCSIKNTPLNQTKSIESIGEKFENIGLNKPASDYNIWLGPAGHIECLHYDLMDGTLVQLYGVKKVVLFPPSQTSNLYPFPFSVHLYRGFQLRCWFAQVYPDRPDFKIFPQLEEAMQFKQEIFLHPGEALFIPAGWWHEVTAEGDDMVCSINRFWRVYPTDRAIFSWSRWRIHLGSILAIPYTLLSLVKALFSSQRQQKVKEILQKL